jgi:hypothetical protein
MHAGLVLDLGLSNIFAGSPGCGAPVQVKPGTAMLKPTSQGEVQRAEIQLCGACSNCWPSAGRGISRALTARQLGAHTGHSKQPSRPVRSAHFLVTAGRSVGRPKRSPWATLRMSALSLAVYIKARPVNGSSVLSVFHEAQETHRRAIVFEVLNCIPYCCLACFLYCFCFSRSEALMWRCCCS